MSQSANEHKASRKNDRWLHGYACACAVVAKLDTPADAVELLKQGGFDRQSLIDDGVDPGDIKAIFAWEDDSLPEGASAGE